MMLAAADSPADSEAKANCETRPGTQDQVTVAGNS